MTTKQHFLTLIIPAYKQEKNIIRDVKNILLDLDNLKYDYEVIVVVDGQVDKTETILRAANLPKVKIISYEKNLGKFAAIRAGMKEAQGDYVMFIDAGGEIAAKGISMLVEHMDWYDADIVVGSKRHPASKVNYPLLRRVYSEGYYYLMRVFFNLKVRDTQAGIKLFNKRILQTILPKLVEKKFVGDLEILIAAKENGFHNIAEAPIEMYYSENEMSSAVQPRAVWGIFWDTLALWYRSKVLRWYKK